MKARPIRRHITFGRRRRFVLWGARRGDWHYSFVTAEEAYRRRMIVLGTHSYERCYVTVARRYPATGLAVPRRRFFAARRAA